MKNPGVPSNRRFWREGFEAEIGLHTVHVASPSWEGQRSMNPNKSLSEKGDFTRIAASLRERGEAVVAALGLSISATFRRVTVTR